MIEVTDIDVYLLEAMSRVLNDSNSAKEIEFIHSFLNKLNSNNSHSLTSISIYNTLYTPTSSKAQSPIVLIALVTFHQQKGTFIESTFPSQSHLLNDPFIASLSPNQTPEAILADLLNQVGQSSLFDGIHLVDSDKEYFLIQNMAEILYGVSAYRQIQANEVEIEDDSENKRNCIQKAICIVSTLPLFEYFITQATVAVDSYFSQKTLKDKAVISHLYEYLITRSYSIISDYQLIQSFNYYPVLCLCKEKLFALIKLFLLERRIVVYAKTPGDVCGFILALLSLCSPGGTLFNYSGIGLSYMELGLPLQLFHSGRSLTPLFGLNDLNEVKGKKGFLIGITNSILLQLKEIEYDCVVNLDERTISIGKEVHERILVLSRREAICFKQLQRFIDTDESKDEEEHQWLRKHSVHLKENEEIDRIISGYFNNMLFDTALAIEISQRRINSFDELIFDRLLLNESPIDLKSIEKCLMILLSTYNIDFIAQWIQTYNFSQWHKSVSTQYLSYRSTFYKCIDKLRIHYPNEDFYEGALKEGKFHFQGSYYSHDDDQTYIGQWHKNQRHGIGNTTNRDNTYLYDGGWENNRKSGSGYLISNGAKYGGGFVNDLFHGEGELIDQEGQRYKGSFIQGKKSGKGKLNCANGDEYEGDFQDDHYHGKGVLTTKDKVKYIGLFVKGILEGKVTIETANHTTSHCLYKNGSQIPTEELLLHEHSPSTTDRHSLHHPSIEALKSLNTLFN